MKSNKTKSLILAYLYSSLIILAGAIIWGLLYYSGLFAAIISIFQIYLAHYVFTKKSRSNWIALLYLSILTIVLNSFSIIIADILAIASKLELSFSRTFKIYFDLIKSIDEFKSTVTKSLWQSILFTVIGIAITIIDINQRKNRVLKIEKSRLNIPKSDSVFDPNQTYVNLYNEVNISYKKFKESKDEKTFKFDLLELKINILSFWQKTK